jgi:hypothetical protein
MMPKGIFYADPRLANYLYFEMPINLFQFIKFYLLGYFSALRPAAVPASLAAARVAAFWALR